MAWRQNRTPGRILLSMQQEAGDLGSFSWVLANGLRCCPRIRAKFLKKLHRPIHNDPGKRLKWPDGTIGCLVGFYVQATGNMRFSEFFMGDSP